MFGKLFGGKQEAVQDQRKRKAALLNAAVGNAQQADAIAPLKVGAEELVQRLLAAMKDERGVHVESLLAVLGSLAGFCAIDSSVQQVAAVGKKLQECGIVAVETTDGSRYYFGDPINQLLAGGDLSLWALVAGAVNHLGSQDYPDVAEISAHVARTVGGDEFGQPRVPESHRPRDLPLHYVRALWPAVLPTIEHHAPELHTRVTLFGFAAQKVIQMAGDVIAPAVAGKLVMECAVPMSKLDPATIRA